MIKVFNQLNILLNISQKKKFIILFFLMIFFSILEFLSIGVIIPLASLILEGNLETANLNLDFLDKIGKVYSINSLIVFFVVIFLVIFVVKFFYSIFFLFIKNKFLYEVRNNFSQRIFKNYLTKPFSFHTNNNTSKLAINCKYELDIFTSNVLSPVLELMTDFILMIGLFILLMYVEPKATLLVIFIFTTAVFIYHSILKKRTRVWAQERQHFDRLTNKVIREGLGAIKEIILNLKENFFIKKLDYYLYRNLIVTVRAQLSNDLPRHMLELIAVFGFLALFFFLKTSGYNVYDSLIIIGLFAAVTFKILPSFNRIMSNVQRLRFGQPVINLLFTELANNNHLKRNIDVKNLNSSHFKETIEVRNLFFKYDGKKEYIFEDLNFLIKKGQFIGLSGESGIGKSTFLNLISGLDKQFKGNILIDGKNIEDLEYGWTQKVAYISQSPFFIDDTIKNNIAFAEEESLIDEDKIWKSIEAAQLKSFVNNLDNGINTTIGEDGTRMSGGQLQRLAIARALYQDFTLIILDESLNSLDIENENKIISILDNLKNDKMIILISHKPETLKNCVLKYKIIDKKIKKY
tara:strand:- start:1700 stop:3430 length:1731 start_codon:yes stop_codon:yes gene_type:complete